MLTQVNHWLEYAVVGIDALLVLRILALRLQRTYTFLTLACVLAVLFDGVLLTLAPESPERGRVEVYSTLLLAFVYPLAAWDVFEEMSEALGAVRRIAILRTCTSLTVMTVVGLVVATAAAASVADDPLGLVFALNLTMIVSTGSAAGCLAFFWVMRRGIRQLKIATPHNTFIWLIFYALSLCSELVSWVFFFIEGALKSAPGSLFPEIVDLVMALFGIVIVLWCAARLKALPKDLPSASLNENS